MFILVAKSPVEMPWLAVIVGVGLTGFAFLCLLAWLDSQEEDDEEKEGFADYKPEESSEPLAIAPPPPGARKRKFYTRFQTADVMLHDEPHTVFQNCFYVPIIPPHLEEAAKKHFVSILTPDGVKITWNTDGSVIQDDDVKKVIFWPMPTLSDAVYHKDWDGRATSFKFKSDGSAIVKAYGCTYYFGSLVEGEPEEGEELEDGHTCYNQDNWWYGYENCHCLFDQQYEDDRNYYDSEDDMYPRCDDCMVRHHPRYHDCRS